MTEPYEWFVYVCVWGGLLDEGLALGSLAWSLLETELQDPFQGIGGEEPRGLIDLGEAVGIAAQNVFRGKV